MPGIKRMLVLSALVLAAAANYGFKRGMTAIDWLTWTNRCLEESYDPSGDTKLKKWELNVTSESFIRLRKTYAKERQEYFSFNLHQLNDMNYSGNTSVGTLSLKTVADDIIVQTRNDRHGDVDSMTTVLNLPVKHMEPERLDSLQQAFAYFKSKTL
jgi:hypothetical protein